MRAAAPADDTAELQFVAVDEMVGSPIRLTDDGTPKGSHINNFIVPSKHK